MGASLNIMECGTVESGKDRGRPRLAKGLRLLREKGVCVEVALCPSEVFRERAASRWLAQRWFDSGPLVGQLLPRYDRPTAL